MVPARGSLGLGCVSGEVEGSAAGNPVEEQ